MTVVGREACLMFILTLQMAIFISHIAINHLKLTRSKQLSKKSSTAIARGRLIENEIKDFEILLIAKPEFLENRHYGSRIAIKGDDLFVSFGERGQGMISQDPSKHPGSISSYQDRWSNPNR